MRIPPENKLGLGIVRAARTNGGIRIREQLSGPEARRLALAAQGFAAASPRTGPDRGDLRRLAERLGAIQIDAVNVLVRSHYLPFFSRLGPYRTADLDECAYASRGRSLFEYWGHEASLLPVASQPLFRWRMDQAARGEGIYKGLARFGRERADFIEAVLAEVSERGGLGVSELSQAGRRSGSWWGWSHGKLALEWLFWSGRITTRKRRGFERIYDLTERVLPARIVGAPTPAPEDAQRALVRAAARALGVATMRDLRDYFRLGVAESEARVAELVESGDLVPASVDGWRQPAYLAPAASIPRRIEAAALLSPFDSLVWDRPRTERLFGFRLRLEIYTPAERREHGYYVLPFLLNERLSGRVDLKADRRASRLLILAAYPEEGIQAAAIAEPLRQKLVELAAWLGLERIHVVGKGALASALEGLTPS